MQSSIDPQGKLDSDHRMEPTLPDVSDIAPTTLKQIGALPVSRDSTGQWIVTLITTRDSGRWSIPKGNPIKKLSKAEAAALEAFEEGGLIGTMSKRPIGSYLFWKRRSGHWELADVAGSLMKIESRATEFKEKGLRQIQNFSFEDAEDAIVEPGLKTLIRLTGEKLNRERG
jgi:8-oxo-dGTP pyrophosphatase MutT (NUDIX family)